MKVRVFKKRNRVTPGRSTGRLKCKLRLPALERTEEFGGSATSAARQFAHLRRFVGDQLPADRASREGASFIIDAEVRSKGGGLRRKRLGSWQDGESVSKALSSAAAIWKALPMEEGWEGEDVEL